MHIYNFIHPSSLYMVCKQNKKKRREKNKQQGQTEKSKGAIYQTKN